MLLGHVVIEPEDRVKFVSATLSPTSPSKTILPPLRVRDPGPSTLPVKIVELELVKVGLPVIFTSEKLKVPAVILVGHVAMEPEAREKLVSPETIPPKMILPPLRVRDPEPPTLPVKVVELLLVKVVVPEIVMPGVKVKTSALMLDGQVSIEPEAKEKSAS